MGRSRKTDKHLPRRVYLRSGSYYFVNQQGRWINLGRDYAGALRKLSDLVDQAPVQTMNGLFDRYLQDVVPKKSPKTQRENRYQIKPLRIVFGHMRPQDIKPKDLYAYLSKRSQRGLTQANREFELLSHCLTKAVEWGVIDANPARHVRRDGYRPVKRDRYVTDEEFLLVHSVASPMVQIAMELALLTGLRRGDLLGLARDNLTDQGIAVRTSKTGKPLLIEWSPALRDVVSRAKTLPPHVRQHLIANRRGKRYTGHGFSSQ